MPIKQLTGAVALLISFLPWRWPIWRKLNNFIIDLITPPLLLYRRIQKIDNKMQKVVFSTLGISASTMLIFSASVVISALLFKYYLPQDAIRYPVDFSYEKCGTSPLTCTDPKFSITFDSLEQLFTLSRGQKYNFYLELTLPDSLSNHEAGMFNVYSVLANENGLPVAYSDKSVMMPYRSPLTLVLSTLLALPLIPFGLHKEDQVVSTIIFQNYQHDTDPAEAAQILNITLKSRHINVYEAYVGIQADFSGLRYYMHHYPKITAFCFVAFFFQLLSFLFLILLYQLQKRKRASRDTSSGGPSQLSNYDPSGDEDGSSAIHETTSKHSRQYSEDSSVSEQSSTITETSPSVSQTESDRGAATESASMSSQKGYNTSNTEVNHQQVVAVLLSAHEALLRELQELKNGLLNKYLIENEKSKSVDAENSRLMMKYRLFREVVEMLKEEKFPAVTENAEDSEESKSVIVVYESAAFIADSVTGASKSVTVDSMSDTLDSHSVNVDQSSVTGDSKSDTVVDKEMDKSSCLGGFPVMLNEVQETAHMKLKNCCDLAEQDTIAPNSMREIIWQLNSPKSQEAFDMEEKQRNCYEMSKEGILIDKPLELISDEELFVSKKKDKTWSMMPTEKGSLHYVDSTYLWKDEIQSAEEAKGISVCVL